MREGGYEAGYAACLCFWGDKPGSLVRQLLDCKQNFAGVSVLDAGCGEGKNAYALAQRGCNVTAVDCSARAIENGRIRFCHPAISWHIADITTWKLAPESYNLVIAYGLLHCLTTAKSVKQLVSRFQAATRPGGLNVICVFDDGPHDMSAHPGFAPTLLSHNDYVKIYDGWRLTTASSSLLYEMHPHNCLPHYHSLTRLIAERI